MNDFIRNITVSWAKDAYTPPAAALPLVKMLQSMKYEEKAKEMLSMPTSTEAEIKKQKAFKAANFPVLIPAIVSGSFHNESVTHDAQIMIIDCDSQDNPEISVDRMFEILIKLPFIVAVSDSIRGRGVYAVIRIKPTRSNEEFHLIAQSLEYELGELGLSIDPSCKNIARKRFFGYHTRQYFKETEPEIYLPLWQIPTQKFKKAAAPDKINISDNLKKAQISVYRPLMDLIGEVEERKLNIAPNYDKFLYLAFALWREFQEEGRWAFHAMCKHSDKYNFQQADKKYSNAHTTVGSVPVDYVYQLIKKAGVDIVDRKKNAERNKALKNYSSPTAPTIQRRQHDYPSNWDQPLNYNPEDLQWRFINWLTNLEAAVIARNHALANVILDEINKAGYSESMSDELQNKYAPTVTKLINQNN